MKRVTLAELAKMIEGEVLGDGSVVVSGLNSLEQAQEGEVSFITKVKSGDSLRNQTYASALLVPLSVEAPDMDVIKVKDPYLASAIVHNFFLTVDFVAEGVHRSAVVAETASLPEQVTVGPNAVIGQNVSIGARTVIEAGVVIGDNVCIGDDCLIKANVTIVEGCLLGNKVILHPGTVIGSDGFGYATNSQGFHFKRPQVGIVEIGDDVEIGANCCVDRATFGVTLIKSGAKFDNQVQVGHNVVIGENSILVAQVGIAGSTTLGRNVVMGGQSATAGHLLIGDGVMVAARGGVHTDLAPGAVVGGAPAMPIKQWGKASAVYSRLPEMRKEIRSLKKELEDLKKQIDDTK